jgi:threonylcarbamoyladenosine tRNA methylthiotransferase MtaB
VAAEPPRIALRTLGCKVNRTESEALAEALAGSCTVVIDSDEGAVVVVNTCTVTGEADAKARKAIRHALAAGAGTVVVTGCLAAIDPEGLEALDPRVVVEPDRAALAGRVSRLAGVEPGDAASVPVRPATLGRIRVMVKVQDGCDHRCTYCIVPDARGPARSVPTAAVVARVSALALAGAAEVVLTGVNIGRYGDPAGAPDLAALVEAVAATPIARLRLSSIEPPDLDLPLLGAISRAAKVVPHLHVPLQSGCDSTLDAMGRGYCTAQYASVLEEARAAIPGLAVTTDVIVGFPGETDADFSQSLAFVEACAFAKLHVFRYSRRAGTPAAIRTDQLPPFVKAARAARMRALGERLAAAYALGRVGQVASVLVERCAGGLAEGTSEDHLRVRFRGSAAVGQVVRVALAEADGAGVFGVPLADQTDRRAGGAAASRC